MANHIVDIINNLSLQIWNHTNGNVTIPTLPTVTLATAFGDLTSILIMISIMGGITTRTLWRFGEKLQNGDISFFDRTFLITAFLAFGSSLLPALGLFAPAATYFVSLYGTVGIIGSLVAVFFMSMGLNEAWNSGAKTVIARIDKSRVARQKAQENKAKEP